MEILFQGFADIGDPNWPRKDMISTLEIDKTHLARVVFHSLMEDALWV